MDSKTEEDPFDLNFKRKVRIKDFLVFKESNDDQDSYTIKRFEKTKEQNLEVLQFIQRTIKRYPDKLSYVLKNIFVAPGSKPFSSFQEQSAYLRKLKTTIFPNNVKFIVIDNISHHLRYIVASNSDYKKRGTILDEFFGVQLFPFIMRCLREKIILILIHEVSFDPNSGKTKPFYSKLYDRINSINVNLSNAMYSGLKQMEVSSKGSSTKFTYQIRDSGIVSS